LGKKIKVKNRKRFRSASPTSPVASPSATSPASPQTEQEADKNTAVKIHDEDKDHQSSQPYSELKVANIESARSPK